MSLDKKIVDTKINFPFVEKGFIQHIIDMYQEEFNFTFLEFKKLKRPRYKRQNLFRKMMNELIDILNQNNILTFYKMNNDKGEIKFLDIFVNINFKNKFEKIVEEFNFKNLTCPNLLSSSYQQKRFDFWEHFILEFLLLSNINRILKKTYINSTNLKLKYLSADEIKAKQIIKIGYITSFDKSHENVYDSILEKLENNEKYTLSKFEGENNLTIIEGLKKFLSEKDIFIVDFTVFNGKIKPNVYYEYGYIDAMGKKIIVICYKNSWKKDYKDDDIFSDKSGIHMILYENYKDLASEVYSKLENELFKDS